jgi:hypothetical protein
MEIQNLRRTLVGTYGRWLQLCSRRRWRLTQQLERSIPPVIPGES